MAGNTPVGSTGQRKAPMQSPGRPLRQSGRRARCEYCRGWVAEGEDRQILLSGETKYVHARHPRRDGEENPPVEPGE